MAGQMSLGRLPFSLFPVTGRRLCQPSTSLLAATKPSMISITFPNKCTSLIEKKKKKTPRSRTGSSNRTAHKRIQTSHVEARQQLKYPAPGAPELAKKVKELLMASGFEHVEEDKTRGLDHGAWVPLMLMYPEADIPVCQLSVQPHWDGSYHYNLGKALAPLKEEGVLIMGSGSATHNLRAPRNCPTPPWALDFDTWLKDALLEGRYEDVNQWEEKAPCAKMAHPWPDHLYPLHVAVGAAGENAKAKLIHHSWHKGGSLSYASYQFTSATV